MKKFWSIVRFVSTERWAQLVIVVIAIVAMKVLLSMWGWNGLHDRWELFVDTAVNMITLLVAIGVWWSSGAQEWEDNLPKRLNVTFVDSDAITVMQCNHATLGGEGDIRGWAQQIGRQMLKQNLEFPPAFIVEKPYVADDGRFKIYNVTLTLINAPACLKEAIVHNSGQHLVWNCKDNGEIEKSWEFAADTRS